MFLTCNLNVNWRPKYFIAFSQDTNIQHCSYIMGNVERSSNKSYYFSTFCI